MKNIKWQFSLYLIVISTILALTANAAQLEIEKRSDTKAHTTRVKSIRNCSLASIQQKRLQQSSRKNHSVAHPKTIYVCEPWNHATKKTTTKKSTKTSTSSTKTTKRRTTSKTHKTTNKHKSGKHSTTRKHNGEKHTTTKTTKANKSGETTTAPIVVAGLPTTSSTEDDHRDTYNEETTTTTATTSTTTTTTTTVTTTTAPPAASVSGSNDPVTLQSVSKTEKDTDTTSQSKVIGVSIGAVVGCLAAAGLAGMFVYKRHQKSSRDRDLENMPSDVQTRWRTDSFVQAVVGVVSKLPHRSNSSRSNQSSASTSSMPAIIRVDGDQAHYYNEPSRGHTHAY